MLVSYVFFFKKNKKTPHTLQKVRGVFLCSMMTGLQTPLTRKMHIALLIERFCFLAPTQKSYIKNHQSVFIYFRTQTVGARLGLLVC
jgi:hypothetical protein